MTVGHNLMRPGRVMVKISMARKLQGLYPVDGELYVCYD